MTKQSNSDKRRVLPIEGKRTKIIAAKVSREQKAYIIAKAQRCGMTVSDFLLSLAYGYEPKARLTPEQQLIAMELIGVRSDIKKFFGNLKSLPMKKRQEMMQSYAYIIQWTKLLVDFVNRLDPVIEMLIGNNPVPRGTTKKELGEDSNTK